MLVPDDVLSILASALTGPGWASNSTAAALAAMLAAVWCQSVAPQWLTAGHSTELAGLLQHLQALVDKHGAADRLCTAPREEPLVCVAVRACSSSALITVDILEDDRRVLN